MQLIQGINGTHGSVPVRTGGTTHVCIRVVVYHVGVSGTRVVRYVGTGQTPGVPVSTGGPV